MENALIIFVLFFVVMAITAVLFLGWLAYRIVTFFLRLIFGTKQSVKISTAAGFVRCPRDKCLADNPMDALFCRRCGARLPPARQMMLSRAAMW